MPKSDHTLQLDRLILLFDAGRMNGKTTVGNAKKKW